MELTNDKARQALLQSTVTSVTPLLCPCCCPVTGGTSKDPGARSVVTQWAQFWTPQGTDPLQVCTCHPTDCQAFCSDHLPEGIHVLITMIITRKTDQGSK
ncbi:hypothetical protein ACOMHN_037776 [Nucella lapillus]